MTEKKEEPFLPYAEDDATTVPLRTDAQVRSQLEEARRIQLNARARLRARKTRMARAVSDRMREKRTKAELSE